MKSINLLLVLLGLISVYGCKQGNTNSWRASNTSSHEDTPVLDSIDIIVAQRAEQELNSTIFAGLRFGDNPNRVKSVLKNSQNRTIYIPIGDRVDSVIIRDYDATYYKEQLDWIRLYANEAELLEPLAILFSQKYGETKKNQWHYSDCIIEINRIERNSVKDYLNRHIGYIDSYRGGNEGNLTEDGFFIEISYKSLSLIEQQNNEVNQALIDSIKEDSRKRNEEIQKRREREAELARKLRTEVPTNI